MHPAIACSPLWIKKCFNNIIDNTTNAVPFTWCTCGEIGCRWVAAVGLVGDRAVYLALLVGPRQVPEDTDRAGEVWAAHFKT